MFIKRIHVSTVLFPSNGIIHPPALIPLSCPQPFQHDLSSSFFSSRENPNKYSTRTRQAVRKLGLYATTPEICHSPLDDHALRLAEALGGKAASGVRHRLGILRLDGDVVLLGKGKVQQNM